jgi:hypothetical protein
MSCQLEFGPLITATITGLEGFVISTKPVAALRPISAYSRPDGDT